MASFFSKKCEYGLQAVLYLAAKDENYVCSVEEISSKMLIPKEFTSKVLQSLTDSGIIESRKGKAGGFKLAKDPSEIKLIEVVEAIDGLSIFNCCVMGFHNCNPGNKCIMHDDWHDIQKKAFNILNNKTVNNFKDSLSKHIQE